MTGHTTQPPRTARWRTVNITPAERIGRIAAGLAGIIVGLVLLTRAASVPAVILEALLIAAGLDLLVTGMFGHCPLYAKLGHVPAASSRQATRRGQKLRPVMVRQDSSADEVSDHPLGRIGNVEPGQARYR